MTAVTISAQILPRIEPSQYMRNELVVTPNAQQGLVAGANQVLAQRPKELFSSIGAVGATSTIPVSTSTRVRWWAAGHTSPYAAKLVFDVLVARPTSAGAAGARLEVLDATETTVLATIDLPYASTTAIDDTPNEFTELIGTVAIAASTKVICRISDTGKGRLVQALVYEQAAAPDTANGYFAADVANGVSITSTQRSAIATAMTAMWKEGAAAVFHAQAHDVDPSTSSTTDENIFNTAVTSVVSSSEGATLDMRYKCRTSKTSVPVLMRVRGSCTGGGTGRVRLKDSGGTTLLEVTVSSTDAWYEVAGTLPATLAKYDIMFAANLDGGSPDYATCPLGSDESIGDMVLQWNAIGTVGNAGTFSVDQPGGSFTITQSGSAITMHLPEATKFSNEVEALIGGGTTSATVLTSDSTPSNAWNAGAIGGPFAFSGGVDATAGTLTVKAVSIYELET